MTPEERALKERELKELKLAKLKAQRAAMTAEPEAEYEPDWKDRVRAGLQGLTLNTADELGAVAGATMAKIDQAVTGRGDQSWNEIRGEMQDQFAGERERYREAAPGEALALELAGGLATGGAGLARTVGKTALTRGLARGGTIAGESALAGGASVEGGLEERLAGARTGAALGLATAGLAKGAGSALKGVTKRRVAQELGKGEDFIPINLADEGMLGKFYRNFLGKTYGGSEVLTAQGTRLGGKVSRELERAAEKSGALKNTLAAEQKAAKAAAARESADFIGRERRLIDNEAAQLQSKLGKATEAEANTFRNRATQSVIPDDATDLKVAVVGMEPLEARGAINKWFKKNMFSGVKGENFKWNNTFSSRLDDVLGKDPGMALELAGEVGKLPGMAAKMQAAAMKVSKGLSPDEATTAAFRKVMKDPDISGDALLAIRNTFARPANAARDAWRAGGLREIRDVFDREIRDQLKDTNPQALAQFDNHLSKWGANRTYNKAVDKAFDKRAGRFGPDDWLSSSKKYPDAPGVGTARASRAATEGLQGQADTAGAQFKKRVAALKEQAGTVKKRALSKSTRAIKAAERKAKATNRLDRAKAAQKKFKNLSPEERTSGLSAALTTASLGVGPSAALGAVVGGPLGALAGTAMSLGTGSRVARGLASPSVQRMFAGQTGTQKAIAKQLREREKLLRGIARGGYRTAAGTGD